MFTKALAIKEMDEKGVGLALLADMNDVDKDDDAYTKGAFSWKADGQWAPILPAHNWKEMPFGKARVFEQDGEALAEIKLNLDTAAGRDWHAAIKFDLETGQPVQQWSYGYDVLDHAIEMRGGKKVRNLKKLSVLEVSTVIVGAGNGTRTLEMKGASLKDRDFAATVEQLQQMAGAIDANPDLLSATGWKQMADIGRRIDAIVKAGVKAKEAGDGMARCEMCEEDFAADEMDGGKCRGCSKKSVGGDGGEADRAIAAFLHTSVKHHLPKKIDQK